MQKKSENLMTPKINSYDENKATSASCTRGYEKEIHVLQHTEDIFN